MMNNKNCSRRPINLRNMQNTTSQMNYDNFLCMKKSQNENIEDMPLAMAYVPYQQWKDLYDPSEALKRGTIFKALDLPFECAKECK